MNRLSRLSALLVASLLIMGIVGVSGVFAQRQPTPLARLVLAPAKGLPDQYIVVLNGDVDARAEAAKEGINPKFVYAAALRGFAAKLSARQLDAIRRNPLVAYVEQDQEASLNPTQNMDINGDPWGLDRIDQRNLPLSGTYTYVPTGASVTAYVIDSGILPLHPDFGGRAQVAYDATGGNGIDCNGHGTHVAGTIGGTVYGVAKQIRLRGVRVFPCSGGSPYSTIIAGIDWVTANAVKPAVANMSLGGPYSAAVNTSVTNLVNSGVFAAVAAGNENTDACTRSPASTPSAFTVAASDRTDVRAGFSNYGSCVDSYAPGVNIKSDWLSNGTNTISGTSMATPHVAGCAALHLDTNGAVPPAAVTSWLINNATLNVISSNPAGTPNRLLYCYKPDVWVKDKSVDTGREPDPATAGMNMWESQDIWIRHAADGIYAHQNPEFGQTNYAYARLRNRGQIAGSGQLRFYVANASSGLAWPGNWTQIGAVTVNNLLAGATLDVNVPWSPSGTGHYCMIVRWVSNQEPMTYTETWDVNFNTRYNNNIAWRNLNVVDLQANRVQRSTFTVRNIARERGATVGAQAIAPVEPTIVPVDPTPEPEPTVPPSRPAITSLIFRESGETKDSYLDHGTLVVDLGPRLFDLWHQGGGQGRGITPIGDTLVRIDDLTVAQLDGIYLEADAASDITLTFELRKGVPAGAEQTYLVQVSQAVEGGREPLGGVSYAVTLPTE